MELPLKILLIEDCPDDAELLLLALRRGGYRPDALRVDSAEAVDLALAQQPWDLVISDYVMPGFSGLQALELFQKHGLDVPFIIVSGHIGEEVAVAALKAGANDYVMKDRLARLAPAIDRALQETRIARAHKRANEELRISHQELSEARAKLEQRVRERTADLLAANCELQRQMTERKRLEAELLEIADNERRRIGFDLHDDIGQKLMGVALMLKAIETNLGHQNLPEAGQIGQVQGLIGEVVNHTHNLAHCFSELDSRDEDLGVLLRKLVASVRRTFHVACHLELHASTASLSSSQVRLQLYMIAQEALSNAIKHGKASRISVTLRQKPGRLVLRIENDGVPFPTTYQPSNRMGLRIMNYRAHTIGGTLTVGPRGDSGTIVTCAVPSANGNGKQSTVVPAESPVCRGNMETSAPALPPLPSARPAAAQSAEPTRT